LKFGRNSVENKEKTRYRKFFLCCN